MPDESKYAKAVQLEWLSKECWLEVIGECIANDPDSAEALMIMLMSVRHLLLGGRYADRRKAFFAISNFIEACQPFTRSEVLWELVQKERGRSDRDY